MARRISNKLGKNPKNKKRGVHEWLVNPYYINSITIERKLTLLAYFFTTLNKVIRFSLLNEGNY
jgi:hypothetical protein